MSYGLGAMQGTTGYSQRVPVSTHQSSILYDALPILKLSLLDNKPEISEPYNFQHLTHTHTRHFQEMSRASHHDLVSEFSAIRASQAPRSELQGIKAQSLQSRTLQSEPTSPARQSITSPPRSPLKPTYLEPTRSPGHQQSQSADYFSQPSPRLYKTRSSTSPIAPPPRLSSRAAVPGFHPEDQTNSYTNIISTTISPQQSTYVSRASMSTDCGNGSPGYFDVPHAITTPDNSAFTLMSPPFRTPKAELADVPEEDDDERFLVRSSLRSSTAGSGLHHSRSFPSSRSNSQSWSRSPRKAKARGSGSQRSQSDDCLSQGEMMLPLVGEPDDDIPLRPRFSRRISVKAQGFDASWEDDIDYCYEHAAEADCDFDWDQVSLRDTEEPTNVVAESTHADATNLDRHVSLSEDTSSQLLPRLETSVPSLCSADSAKSSSFSSIAGPPTPCYPLPSPQHSCLPSKGSMLASSPYTLNTPLLVSRDSSSMLQEEAYENMFSSQHYLEDAMPLHNLRFEPPASREESPRSSRSPISKCNSQESFMVSRSSSFRYLRSNDSMGSLPDLVHSKHSRDGLNLSQEQLGELAATIKASEPFLEVQQSPVPAPLRQRSNQSLAKEVARQSMLQNAASFGSFDEEEEHEIDGIVILPNVGHHERSQSAAFSQPAIAPSYQQRKRSATSASGTTKNRVSYSLFPSPPARTP